MNLIEEFESRAKAEGYKVTSQRVALVEELARSNDHPTAEELLNRVRKKCPRYTSASIYRTLNVLEKLGLILRHNFKGGTARIEAVTETHHNHLIDVESGDIVEFRGKRIEALQHEMAERLGYEVIDYKLEIYARPKHSAAEASKASSPFARRKRAPFVARA